MRLKQKSNIQILKTIIYKLYVPTFILFLVINIISDRNKIRLSVFIRDPALIASNPKITPFIDPNHNPFIGIVSQIGILFWCISASLCLFCSFSIFRQKNIFTIKANFLRFFGFFTSVLLIDDLFMLHESVFPYLLMIPEPVTYLLYGLFCIWGLLKYKKVILKTDWIILLLSLFWFGCSVGIDSLSFLRNLWDISYVLEDAFKLLGIVSWFYYFLLVCLESFEGLEAETVERENLILSLKKFR